jgi:hypothetical protein
MAIVIIDEPQESMQNVLNSLQIVKFESTSLAPIMYEIFARDNKILDR